MNIFVQEKEGIRIQVMGYRYLTQIFPKNWYKKGGVAIQHILWGQCKLAAKPGKEIPGPVPLWAWI